MRIFSIVSSVAVAALMVFGLTACGEPSETSPTQPSEEKTAASSSASAPTAPINSEPASVSADAAGADCYVHLFDSDNLDESDDNLKLNEPGKYANLKGLSGAKTDWTDEADSIKVGPAATVTIWSQTDFQGKSMKLMPGSEHPKVDVEPSSLEMTCSDK